MADEIQEVDLRAAINAVSDVVQNRPRPLREFDQIYMKTGDMVYQSEVVASWADDRRLAFIGDGDAIGVSVAYLGRTHGRGLFAEVAVEKVVETSSVLREFERGVREAHESVVAP